MCVPTIDLATNEELLQELFHRNTFAGAVVYSPDNHRFPGQQHKEFMVLTTCDEPSAVFLLESALTKLKNRTNGP
jgi:hypothetical protein